MCQLSVLGKGRKQLLVSGNSLIQADACRKLGERPAVASACSDLASAVRLHCTEAGTDERFFAAAGSGMFSFKRL